MEEEQAKTTGYLPHYIRRKTKQNLGDCMEASCHTAIVAQIHANLYLVVPLAPNSTRNSETTSGM